MRQKAFITRALCPGTLGSWNHIKGSNLAIQKSEKKVNITIILKLHLIIVYSSWGIIDN